MPPGLSLTVGVGTDVALTRAYGLADVATARPMTPDTVGPTGSDSKAYTAVAALQLVERGVIGLDDPLDEHVRNPLGERSITLRDLLTHRSGLGTNMGNWDHLPPPPLADHLRQVLTEARSDAYGGTLLPFWAAPVGERYTYSNIGIALVGHLVELLNPDGVTFSEWVARHVFAPLGMASTVFPRAQHPDHVPAELLARRSTGYATLPGLRLALPPLYPGDWPAGSALSTPSDHTRFILALLNGGELDSGSILTPETAQQMITAQASGGTLTGPSTDASVGFVFNVFDGGEHPYIGHGGEYLWGWNHFTRGWTKDRVVLVISTNQYDLGDLGLSDRPSHAAARLVAEVVTAWVHGADPPPPAHPGVRPQLPRGTPGRRPSHHPPRHSHPTQRGVDHPDGGRSRGRRRLGPGGVRRGSPPGPPDRQPPPRQRDDHPPGTPRPRGRTPQEATRRPQPGRPSPQADSLITHHRHDSPATNQPEAPTTDSSRSG
ncbi:serine hydrolase domain-containing protein [Nonomuraea salmonea]|uniref:serine hydrolase domain-containing protein n=1 Tax=Nonomuraea salmonea TaxID=46181 RepID=UPI002FEA5FC6